MLQCTAGTLLRRRHSGHLNSSADIFQLGAFETMHVFMMSLQLRQACRQAQQLGADHA